jgi:serine/threonine protein kinase
VRRSPDLRVLTLLECESRGELRSPPGMMVGNDTTLDEVDLSEVAREQVGPYELIRRLGAGGMAEVHLARAAGIEGFEKLVVLKRILPHLSADPHFIRMFLAEARLAAILDHPNIVQVFDLGHDGGEYYFTMEFVYGENLQNILRAVRRTSTPLPYEHAITICNGVAAGLHYAHERVGFDGQRLGLVHRDVSPTNVMVTYEGCAKVADFGIAKVMNRTDVTQAGMRKGKVPYMSPEQCRAEPLDPRSDVFALGIVLYEATTMRRLFDGENEFGVMNRIVNGDVPPPSSIRSGYPKDLERIVMRALSTNRNERHGSALELQWDLERFARERKMECTPLALRGYLHQVFTPQPFPWGALMGDGGGGRPSAMATMVDIGHGSGSMPGRGVDQATPASVPSYMRQSQPSMGSIGSLSIAEQRRSTLKGVAIGLGTAAFMAVLSVGGLWVLTRDDDAAAEEATPSAEAEDEATPEGEMEPSEAPPAEVKPPPEIGSPEAPVDDEAADVEPEGDDASADLEVEVEELVEPPSSTPTTRPKTASSDAKPRPKPAKTKKQRPVDRDAFWPE